MKYPALFLLVLAILLVGAAPLAPCQQPLAPDRVPQVSVHVGGADPDRAFASLADAGVLVVQLGSLSDTPMLIPPGSRFRTMPVRSLVEAIAAVHGLQVSWWSAGVTVAVLQRGAPKDQVAGVMAGLSSPALRTRAEAAWRAGWTEDASVVPALAAACSDPDSIVSFQALRSLKRLGWPAAVLLAPGAALSLVGQVDDVRYAFSPAAWRAMAAAWQERALPLFQKAVDQEASDCLAALAAIPGDAAAALLESSRAVTRSPYFRRQAVAALGRRAGSAAAWASLTDALKDPVTYDAALPALGRSGKDRAMPTIEAALQGVHRVAAFAALAEVGNDRAVSLCVTALADPDPVIRQAAAGALGRMGGPSALTALKKALADPSVDVWRAALAGLGELGGSEAAALVVASAGSPRVAGASRDTSGAVPAALVAAGTDQARQALAALLADPAQAAAAADALAGIGDAASLSALSAGLPGTSSAVRSAIVRAIGVAGGAGPAPLLLRTAADTDPEVTRALLEAAARAGSIDALAAVRGRADPVLRRLAAAALGTVGGPDAVTALGALLADADPGVRAAAVDGLAAVRLPQCVAALQKALADPDPGVKVRAREALGRIGGDEAVSVIAKLMDTDPAAAVAALPFLDPARTPSLWSRALSNTGAAVQAAALAAVRDLGTDRAGAILRAMAMSDSADARTAAAIFLPQVIGYAAFKDLAALAKDTDTAVRQQAIRSLAAMPTEEATTLYAAMLVDPNETTRRLAAQGLAGISDTSRLERLLRAAVARDTTVLVDSVRRWGTTAMSTTMARITGATPEAMKAAVEAGDLARVKDLVAKGADPAAAAWDGPTPLARAAAAGFNDLVGYLVPLLPEATRPATLASALKAAGTASRSDTVQLLLAQGAEPAEDLSAADSLVRAAGDGRLDLVIVLLGKGWRVDAPDAAATTPLAMAAGNGKLEMVKYLLSKGARVNARGVRDMTPLMRAAANGQTAVLPVLLKAGARLDLVDKDGRKAADYAYGVEASALLSGVSMALVDAVKAGDLAAVKRLATRDNVNVREDGKDLRAENGPWGRTPLIIAAQDGTLEIVKVLVDKGARLGDVHTWNPETEGTWEATAFEVAVVHGNADVVSYLIGKGEKATDELLLGACRNGSLEVAKVLVEHGARVSASRPSQGWQGPDAAEWAEWGGDTLSAAIEAGSAPLVDYLLAKGARPSRYAVAAYLQAGKVDQAKALLSRGADVDAAVLVAATRVGDPALVSDVIRRAADVNAIAPNGRTALTAAVETGSLATVRAVLAAGADPGTRDGYGRTALDLAEDRDGGDAYAIRRFLDRMGPDRATFVAREQLSTAVAKKDAATVKKLLAQKLDPDSLYTSLDLPDGLTAPLVELACVMGSKEIVQLFVQAGATVGSWSAGLQYAAYAGRTDILDLLLRARVGENDLASNRLDNLLSIAAETNNTALLDYALKNGAKPSGGMAPALMTAAGKGYVKIAEALLSRGADPDMTVQYQWGTPLLLALQKNQPAMVDLLLARGAGKAVGPYAGQALPWAVRAGKPAWVKSLLDNGTDVNARASPEPPILVSAVMASAPRLEIVQQLVSRGARLEDRDSQGYTALARAAAIPGSEAFTTYLLKQGAAADAKVIDTLLGFGTWNDEIAGLLDKAFTATEPRARYFMALMKRDLQAAASQLAQGVPVDARAAGERTALMTFAARGDAQVIAFLLARGADPALEERSYKLNAAEMAASAGQVEAARTLIAALPDSQAMRDRLLRQAARGGSAELANQLLAAGAAPDAPDAGRLAALFYAASAGSADLVTLLLDKGADVNREGGYGYTALGAAAGRGATDIVKLLLSRGAKIREGYINPVADAIDAHHLDLAKLIMDSASPAERKAAGPVTLYRVAADGNLDAVKLLLGYGVAPTYEAGDDSALAQALKEGYREIALLLVQAGAPLDGPTPSPLLAACENGWADVVKAMLARGVNVEVADENGTTAIVLAARSGSVETFSLLLPKAKTGLTPRELAYFLRPEK